jgi:hypothetical protein
LINSLRSGIQISSHKRPGKLFVYSDLWNIQEFAWLKNYIERLEPVADADGAMAFFYPPLNSWVSASSDSLAWAPATRDFGGDRIAGL